MIQLVERRTSQGSRSLGPNRQVAGLGIFAFDLRAVIGVEALAAITAAALERLDQRNIERRTARCITNILDGVRVEHGTITGTDADETETGRIPLEFELSASDSFRARTDRHNYVDRLTFFVAVRILNLGSGRSHDQRRAKRALAEVSISGRIELAGIRAVNAEVALTGIRASRKVDVGTFADAATTNVCVRATIAVVASVCVRVVADRTRVSITGIVRAAVVVIDRQARRSDIRITAVCPNEIVIRVGANAIAAGIVRAFVGIIAIKVGDTCTAINIATHSRPELTRAG
jgi:hypothetical protein